MRSFCLTKKNQKVMTVKKFIEILILAALKSLYGRFANRPYSNINDFYHFASLNISYKFLYGRFKKMAIKRNMIIYPCEACLYGEILSEVQLHY